MMTEMDDVMVYESNLAARTREQQDAVSKTGVFENSVVDSPASGAIEVTGQVVEMETSPPAPSDSPVGDDMSKHGDGAESQAGLAEGISLPMHPSEGGRVIEVPFESSTFPSPYSGISNAIAGEGTAVAQKKRRHRGKNWAQKNTDDLLRAVLNTKECTRMEQGTACGSYWDAVAELVPGRTGDECRMRMDTLKKSFKKMKKYCAEQLQEFKQLNEMDFAKMKVSPRLTEEWYNQIRDHCPPRPKKKLKTIGAGSSSKNSGPASASSSLGVEPPVLSDGINQGSPSLVASGPVTLPMEDPPACLELQVAAPFQQQAPPVPEEDVFENLCSIVDLVS